MKKKVFKIFLGLLLIATIIFFLYFNNTYLVSRTTVAYYTQIKTELKARGLKSKLLVVSTKRFKWHNWIQVKIAGAAPKSRHLHGVAIDFIVFNVNDDGSSNSKDVDIVFEILHNKIIQNRGGIGTYKKEHSFFYRQMIHIDAREQAARWTE